MKMTVIPAIPKFSIGTEILTVRKKVAAYARVSTDSEEQLTSYAAQVDYYTKKIQDNDEWEFVGIYTDEGISATNTKHRDGFNTMIEDALLGKIDLILTKSVSRFARNTVDTLTTVRKLKEKGVEVYFEKENIYTLDSKGELLITIMSSLAQEESRSISENVTWGQRKRFSDGKISLPYKSFLGYEKGEDNLPKIVEKEAKIVRMMYRMYLEGKTPTYIANYLTKLNIPTPGNKTRWQASTVANILTNEKYKGDAILQKYFTVDFLSKKRKLNEGEVQQYYIEDSHPAIISPEVFDLVQIEFQKRKGKRTSTAGTFASKLICGECSGYYGSKVWHSNSKYKRTIWQCNQKFKNKEKCKTPHFTDEQLQKYFVDMFNSTIENRDKIISDIEEMIISLTNTDKLDKELQTLQEDLKTAATDIQLWVNQNTTTQSEQSIYEKEYKKRVDIYKKISAEIEDKEQAKVIQINKQKEAINILRILKNNKTAITDFDEGLFQSLIEHIIVKSSNLLIFTFKDGSEVEWEI